RSGRCHIAASLSFVAHMLECCFFFFSSRRRHTRLVSDWSSDVCSSDLFANADGSYTRRVYAGPVNYQAADGSWRPIDTSLVRGADGRSRVKANSIGVDFAGRANDGRLASLQLGPGRSVSYALSGAAAVGAVVAAARGRYADVLAGTGLVLSSGERGFKGELVLRSADVATSWVFPLDVRGLTPRLGAGGVVEFVDGAGKDGAGTVAAVVPPGFMRDAGF